MDYKKTIKKNSNSNIFKKKYLKYKKKYLKLKKQIGGQIKSVTVLLLAKDTIDNFHRALVHRRSYGDVDGKGLVAIPGGMIDSGETPKQAVIRELNEEAGIINPEIIKVKWNKSYVLEFKKRKKNRPIIHKKVFYFYGSVSPKV